MSGLKIVLWWGSWLVLRVNTDFVHSSSHSSTLFLFFLRKRLWISKDWSLKSFDVYLWGSCVFTHLCGHQFCCPHTHTSVFILRYSLKLWTKRQGWVLFYAGGQFHCHFASQTFCFKRTLSWTFSCFRVELTQWTMILQRPQATKPPFFFGLYIPQKTECLLHVVTAPKCNPELLIIQYIIYWWICWLEALYNRWLCCGCCLVCAVAEATEVPSSPTPVTVFQ